MSAVPQFKKGNGGFGLEAESPFDEALRRFLAGEDAYQATRQEPLGSEADDTISTISDTASRKIDNDAIPGRTDLETRLNVPLFEKKVLVLANDIFDDQLDTSYSIRVNDVCYQDTFYTPETGVTIDMTVKDTRATKGRIEFYLADGFLDKLEGTARFVSAVSKYLDCNIGYHSAADLVDAAYEQLPHITSERARYKLTFQFDVENSKVGFEVSIPRIKGGEENPGSLFGPHEQVEYEVFKHGVLSSLGIGETMHKE